MVKVILRIWWTGGILFIIQLRLQEFNFPVSVYMNNTLFYTGSPCEVPFTPVNGDFICTRDSIGVNCTLSCSEGYDFTEGSTERYYCAYEDGIWQPPYSTEWPDCASKF